MQTTLMIRTAALLRAVAAWAAALADRIDPLPPDAGTEGGGGAGPVVPPPRPK